MYSVMWSEHCSYKSSRIHLRRLPDRGAPGAGRPGRGSGRGRRRRRHRRRPAHREPQPPVGHRALPGRGHRRRRHPPRHLLDGRPARSPPWTRCGSARSTTPAAAGSPRASCRASPATATPSACPTVGGEVVFDETFADNPLVNVLCLGVLPVERLVLGRASGVGNLAVLLGSSTGRDGIGGVSVLASAGFGEGDADSAKRPSVQVGDPFEEKRLIEACLELLDRRPGRRRAGPRRRRPHVRHLARRRQGRLGHGRATCPRCPSASRAWRPSRS